MIQIDMLMPKRCDDCRFCIVEYTDDNNPYSYAYCCADERRIAQASDGTDKIVSTAILKKQDWCPLKVGEFGMIDTQILLDYLGEFDNESAEEIIRRFEQARADSVDAWILDGDG